MEFLELSTGQLPCNCQWFCSRQYWKFQPREDLPAANFGLRTPHQQIQNHKDRNTKWEKNTKNPFSCGFTWQLWPPSQLEQQRSNEASIPILPSTLTSKPSDITAIKNINTLTSTNKRSIFSIFSPAINLNCKAMKHNSHKSINTLTSTNKKAFSASLVLPSILTLKPSDITAMT